MNAETMDWSSIERYNDAIVGSRRLRDALLFARGIVPPDEPPPALIRLPTKPAKPRKVITRQEMLSCCPHCGSPKDAPKLLMAHIQSAVASYFGLHISAMTSARRDHEIAHPRQIAMYLASELTGKPLSEIGRRFGNRDHTTVIHALKAVRKRMATDNETAADVAALREALEQ